MTRRDEAPRTAVLVQRRLAGVDDVSRKGCCLRTVQPLKVGKVGLLAVTIAGRVHLELFRVARSVAVADDEALYEAGLEFLPMPTGTASLHDLAARLEDEV